jgi:TonB family protein
MPAMPSRLAGALAVSAALHAAVAAGLHGTGGTGEALAPETFVMQAQLAAPARPAVRPAPGTILPARYYRLSELDERPQIMTRVNPAYPEAAARRFLGGRVVIRLDLDETGAVERVRAVKAQPAGYFESSAEQAFAVARFTPGVKDGKAVKVRMMLEVNFDSAPPPDPGKLRR